MDWPYFLGNFFKDTLFKLYIWSTRSDFSIGFSVAWSNQNNSFILSYRSADRIFKKQIKYLKFKMTKLNPWFNIQVVVSLENFRESKGKRKKILARN